MAMQVASEEIKKRGITVSDIEEFNAKRIVEFDITSEKPVFLQPPLNSRLPKLHHNNPHLNRSQQFGFRLVSSFIKKNN